MLWFIKGNFKEVGNREDSSTLIFKNIFNYSKNLLGGSLYK